MADILDKITAYKREEVARAKTLKPLRVISEYARSAPRVAQMNAGSFEALTRTFHVRTGRSVGGSSNAIDGLA